MKQVINTKHEIYDPLRVVVKPVPKDKMIAGKYYSPVPDRIRAKAHDLHEGDDNPDYPPGTCLP